MTRPEITSIIAKGRRFVLMSDQADDVLVFTRSEVWCLREVLNNTAVTATREDRIAYLIRKAAKNSIPVERLRWMLDELDLHVCTAEPSCPVCMELEAYRPDM